MRPAPARSSAAPCCRHGPAARRPHQHLRHEQGVVVGGPVVRNVALAAARIEHIVVGLGPAGDFSVGFAYAVVRADVVTTEHEKAAPGGGQRVFAGKNRPLQNFYRLLLVLPAALHGGKQNHDRAGDIVLYGFNIIGEINVDDGRLDVLTVVLVVKEHTFGLQIFDGHGLDVVFQHHFRFVQQFQPVVHRSEPQVQDALLMVQGLYFFQKKFA